MDLFGRFATFLLGVVVIIALGGVVFLAMWDFEPDTAPVERVLSNDRFPT